MPDPTQTLGVRKKKGAEGGLFLDETGKKWLEKYEPTNLRAKRLAVYTNMDGFTTL